MSFKVSVIGAGSVGFTRMIVRDLLSVKELQDIDISFHDINEHNLDMVYQLCKRDIESAGISATLSRTLDRRECVKDAKYILSFVRVGGLEAFQTDIDIPLKYGVDQCVGDTLCAGGIMYGQRTMAAMLDFCKDIKELSRPDVLMLNYSNPMSMNTWICNKYGNVNTIGLCHGVEGGIYQIAKSLGLEYDDLDIICAGINHQTWYIQVKHNGEDMLTKILPGFEADEELSKTEKVRIDMMKRFGYYSTESNGHLSEYVPWYRKRPEEIEKWIDTSEWIHGETGGYLRVCKEGRNWFEADFPNWMNEPPLEFAQDKRSKEHGSFIIESLETGRIYRGHFNVRNNDCITNLPADAIVEVPGYIDGNGVSIPIIGDLPMGCAAVCSQSINVQRLSVEAAATGNIEYLRQAMLLDPLVGAVCNPPEVWQMVDELLIAQEEWLPQYTEAIKGAKERMAGDNLISTKEGYTGAVRLHTKTVEEMAENRAAAIKNTEADKATKL